MTAELGKLLALVAFVLTLVQGGLGLWAGAKGDQRLSAASAAAAQAAFVAILASFALLVSLFLRSDFSVSVVAENSHTFKPLIYKIAGTWGNHEGSMLLWCLVSCLFAGLFASLRGRLQHGLWSRALGVQGLVSAAALAYTLFLSSPFARLDPAPLQGADLNPLLQDPALAAHPPLLYVGYVGLSLPFSLAIAALLEGKADLNWARALRPWTLTAWVALTIGIALGSYWAYYELGWGGWWFWDPVENASFMPWLAATALIHSAIVTERRGSLASWTILLAILGFGLALLGTFLVRSGVLTSVHAFAVDPRRGVAVLAMLAAAVGVGLALYAWRAPALSKPAGFAAVSREGALVFNNYALAVACGTVLIGTLYPIFAQAATGRLVSVGPPFFNLTFGPLMGVMFVALPFSLFLAWRKGDLGIALRWLTGAAAVSVIAAGIAFAWGQVLWAALGFGLGVWVILGTLAYVWKRAGEGGAKRAARILVLPAAVWAVAIAHAGVGVLTIGAVAEMAFRQERSVRLAPGQSATFEGRTVTLERVVAVEGPNYYGERAEFRVTHGADVETTAAERRMYPAAGSPTSEVGILPHWDGDLYIALGEGARSEEGRAWTVRLYHNPLVQLIFIGASLMAAGGAIGLYALARRRLKAPAPEAAATVQAVAP